MKNLMTDVLGAPKIVDRSVFQAELDALRVREKAHTREGDAIAAARRRLPMVEVDGSTPLIGEHGPVTLLDVFDRRRMLIAYYFMGSSPFGVGRRREVWSRPTPARRFLGSAKCRRLDPCQGRSRQRRWPKASLYKDLAVDDDEQPRSMGRLDENLPLRLLTCLARRKKAPLPIPNSEEPFHVACRAPGSGAVRGLQLLYI